ncbi:uncharacterized protein PITG_19618, partial [Phytophthora infestans T30-4]
VYVVVAGAIVDNPASCSMSTRRNTLYQAAADVQANQNAPLPQGVADQDVPVLNPAPPPAVQAVRQDLKRSLLRHFPVFPIVLRVHSR